MNYSMLVRKMLGGNFTSVVEGNHSQYDKTASSQLQLIGRVTTQYPAGLVMINYASNDHTPTDTHPNKRVREEEPTLVQQKLHLHKPNRSRLVLNPYPISPGLRLSRDSSSISSTSENPTNASPFARSLTNTVKTEIDRQMEEIGQYIKLQRENILKGGREIKERHTTSLLSALEKGLSKRLHEKDVEIESMNSKNKELEERIKQVSTEAQSWHDKADFNELVANLLSKNFEQMLARGVGDGGCEGFGDSEGDDALSTLKQPGVGVSGECDRVSRRLRCRACNENRVSMLLFPCRHLCLCDGCEGRVGVCPVCRVVKTASFPVNL